MSSIRCKYCGLTNFVDAVVCKRCGNPPWRPEAKKPPVRFSFYTLLVFAIVGVVIYYAIGGFESSMSKVNADEASRQAVQQRDDPNGLPRSEYDKQRAGQYGGAVRNSNSLNEAQKHNEELKKAIDEAK
jgi:ribosomal protein L40E